MLSVGRGQCHLRLSPCFQSLPTLPTSILRPFRCWFLGGWACVCSRILWAPPMTSPVRLGVSPTATTTLTGFYSQRFWGFSFLCWNFGLCSLSRSPVVSPDLSACECGKSQSSSCCLACAGLPAAAFHAYLLPRLPISSFPTSLDACFFFNFLVVRLPYSLILWQL